MAIDRQSSKLPRTMITWAPCTTAWASLPAAILPSGMRTAHVMPARVAYAAAEAEVFPVIDAAAPDANVVVSGANWVDVMHPEADKGVALRALADALGIAHSETVAFGDYLNDYALLQAAGTAWAMDNAHPELKAIADHIAPSNVDHGVVTVLKDHFGLE